MTEFVYDLVPEEHRITDEQWRAILASSNAERRAAKVLGKAVHPNALKRLFELWPDAEVRVKHQHVPVELPPGEQKMGRRYHTKHAHATWVFIKSNEKAVFGRANCHHEDNFDKRYGIQLAFRRALDDVRRIENE